MKRFFVLILSILSLNLCFAQSQQRENLKKDVYYLSSDALEIANVAMLNGWEDIFSSTQTDLKIKVSKYKKSVFTDSDYSSFAKRDIPAITMTTGTDSPYHKPEDDAELIDYEGMDRICDFVFNLTVKASNKFGFIDRYNKDVKITYRESIFGLTYYF